MYDQIRKELNLEKIDPTDLLWQNKVKKTREEFYSKLSPISQENRDRIKREIEQEKKAQKNQGNHQRSSRPKELVCEDIFLDKPIKINGTTYRIIPGCFAKSSKWDGNSRFMMHKPECKAAKFLWDRLL